MCKLGFGQLVIRRPGASEPTIERYWSPPLEDAASLLPDEYELEELLDSAVKRQMISDVPLGAFCRGIDLPAGSPRRDTAHDPSARFLPSPRADGRVTDCTTSQRFATEHTVLRAEEGPRGAAGAARAP